MSFEDYKEPVVDADTGEIVNLAIPEAQSGIMNFQGIAQSPFDKDTQKKLSKFDDSLVRIRPDGLLYYPQVQIRKILNDAFGQGAWAIRRLNAFAKDNKIMFDGELWVLGRYVAGAIGEHDYKPNNPLGSYATSLESAKSDCLVRCCKDLGIAADLWDMDYVEKWKKDYALGVWCVNQKDQKDQKKKLLWRKKTDDPIDQWPWKEDVKKQSQPETKKQSEPSPKNTSEKPPDTPQSTNGAKKNKSTSDDKMSDIEKINLIGQLIIHIADGNKEKASQLLMDYSAFENKDGKVPGFNSITAMNNYAKKKPNNKWFNTILATTKKEFIELFGEAEYAKLRNPDDPLDLENLAKEAEKHGKPE